MKFDFDINVFNNDKIKLLKILVSLKSKGLFQSNDETDLFFSTSPALACNYVRNIKSYDNGKKQSLSQDLEKVFIKNVKYGLKYLLLVGRESFLNKEIDRKFKQKLFKDPYASFYYAKNISKKRIEKEEVFLENYKCLYHYAFSVIGEEKLVGEFSVDLHSKIKLLLFNNEISKSLNFNFLKAYIDKNSNIYEHFYSWRFD